MVIANGPSTQTPKLWDTQTYPMGCATLVNEIYILPKLYRLFVTFD